MKIVVAYCYPLVHAAKYFPLAKRFAETWRQCPPGAEHELHIICNGSTPRPHEINPFQGIPHHVHTRDNTGWDIGAFQWAADNLTGDLLVCLGAPVHFHRPNWLAKMVEAYVEHGPNLYGCWAYLSPNWHVRTTCFWCHPELLKSYPDYIGSDRKSRYEFEHGNKSFTRHVLRAGLECIMVTWPGCFPFSQWLDHAPGVNESLVLDQHTHR